MAVMFSRLSCPLFLILLLLAASERAGHAQAVPDAFHRPMSQAELFLDIVLHRVDSDPQALDNLLGGRGKRNFHPSVDYKGMLSPALLADIGQVEREAVRANCGGQYLAKDVCGLDFMPVTCSQDTAPVYYYRTESVADDRVRIAYRWAPDDQTVATYLLIRRDGVWQLDGIDCETGDAFNWGDR